MRPWEKTIEAEETGVATLRRPYMQNRVNPVFLPDVAQLLEVLDEDAAWRAVWILKKSAEDGLLGAPEIESVARNVEVSRHWAARLLLCQLFAQVECPESEHENVFGFLVKCFEDRRVIVRAWALSAMWRLRRDPRFRTEFDRCIHSARKDHGKAMQARLRQLKRNAGGLRSEFRL